MVVFQGHSQGSGQREQVSFGWEIVLQREILPSFPVSREKHEALYETNSAGLYRHSLVFVHGLDQMVPGNPG